MSGRNEIDVHGLGPLQIEHDLSDPGRIEGISDAITGDRMVLTVDATQGASREEYGSTSGKSAYRRLFPLVKRASSDEDAAWLLAVPTFPFFPVHTTHSRTERAIIVSLHHGILVRRIPESGEIILVHLVLIEALIRVVVMIGVILFVMHMLAIKAFCFAPVKPVSRTFLFVYVAVN